MDALETFARINYYLTGKEFIVQHTKRGWRCISWSPHYIMTEWVKSKKQAILDGDEEIQKFYSSTVLIHWSKK
jgi:hypothetical protein